MVIEVLRRAIASDLQEKFPSPTLEQRQVISAVLGVLSEAERFAPRSVPRSRSDVSELGTWRDTSFLGMRFDSNTLEDEKMSNSRQTLDRIRRSRSINEQRRLAQDAIAVLPSGSMRSMFQEIARSTSASDAANLATKTIKALDTSENRDSAPVTVDQLMQQMKTNPLPAYDGWGEVPLNADGHSLMEKARSNYSVRQRKAQKRQDAIDKALENEPAPPYCPGGVQRSSVDMYLF